MSVKKLLSLTGGKQLIDLNGASTNFDLTFTATSAENAEFHALVVDQNTLDKIPHENLEFKRASGSISGNIVSDKNIYQNYFLCLKSDKPCDVEVVINKKEIQPKQSDPQNYHQNHPQNHSQNYHQNHNPNHSQKVGATAPRVKHVEQSSSKNWKLIFIIIVIIIGGGLCYYMYVNKKKQQKNQAIENTMTPSISTLITSPSLVSGFTTPSLSERLDKLLQ